MERSAIVATAAATVAAFAYVAIELRALRKLLESQRAATAHAGDTLDMSHEAETMTASGIGRMKVVGSVLSGLPRAEHNKLVAALSSRASPVTRWGPVLAGDADAVRSRLRSLQTCAAALLSPPLGVRSSPAAVCHAVLPCVLAHPRPDARAPVRAVAISC